MTKIKKAIFEVIPKRLQAYDWGSQIDEHTYKVDDVRGLHFAIGVLRYAFSEVNTRVYYRGQAEDHVTGIVPSLYRGADTAEERSRRDDRLNRAISLVKAHANWDPKGTAAQSEALAQHYGLRTRWVDAVDHVQTATWFAYERKDIPEDGLRGDTHVGYVYLIAIPEKSEHSVSDLRERGSNWIRPHVQQAFGIATNAKNPNLNAHVAAKFVLPAELLRAASGHDFYNKSVFFPYGGQDQGRYFWTKAARVLRDGLSDEDFRLLVWSDGVEKAEMTLDEIVELLHAHRQRATYGAVAAIVGGGAARGLMKDRLLSERNSWVVAKSGVRRGWPNGYSDDQIHPDCLDQIRSHPYNLIDDADTLRRWLKRQAPHK